MNDSFFQTQMKWLGGTLILGTLILVLACIPASSGLGQPVGQKQAAKEPPSPPPVPIAASAVIDREVTAVQTFVATVRPTRTAMIGSAASGRVAECFLDEGDRVNSMQPLAQLLTETISSEIEQAEAELDLKQSELAELMNGTRPEELQQAKARMLAADARRKFNELNRKRVEQLHQRQSASVNERDEAISLSTGAENDYIDSKAAFELAELGPRQEKIVQAKAAAAMQSAIVKKLKDQKRKHTIISRFDGYVIKEYTEVGAWVNTGDLVFEVSALDEVDVEAFMTEFQVPSIRLGMEINVVIPALGDRTFPGTIAQIIPQADLKTRTFPVRIRVENEVIDTVPLIKAGMFARVDLPIGNRQKANLVPKDALVYAGSTVNLMVIRRDSQNADTGTIQPVPVELGVSQGGWIQAIGSIEPGQLVVVEGNERLRPGQSVVIAEVKQPAKQ